MKNVAIFLFVAILALVPWYVDSRYIFHIATMIVIMVPLALIRRSWALALMQARS